jgi:hypothetical protein
VLVQLLSVPICTLCDVTVESLTHLTRERPLITVQRLNMADHPGMLEQYGLLSFEYDTLASHAVIINGRLAGVGHPSEDTLRGWLEEAFTVEEAVDPEFAQADMPED